MRRRKSRAYVALQRAIDIEILEKRVLLSTVTLGQQAGAPNSTQFHGSAARTGFETNETTLTPTNVASSLDQVWQSPVLDGAVYATPIYADSVGIYEQTNGVNGNAPNHSGDGIQSTTYMNKTLGVAFVATGGGSVYAIATGDTNGPSGIAPGTILWHTKLGAPYGSIDGNAIGVLSTPIIDLASGRLYVCASVTDYLSSSSNPNHGGNNFEVFALSIHDGSLVSGWPLIYTQTMLDSLDQNTLESSTNGITNATVSAGVVTITTSAANGLTSGELVRIAGVGNGYNGNFAITSVNTSNNTFTYADASATGTVTNAGTATGLINVAFSSSGADQRGALNLNADGSTLYVDFACYGSSNGGWMTAVATGVSNGVADGQTAAIVSAYSAIDNTQVIANGGMWGAGGPDIDSSGNVFVTTGDSPPDSGNPPGDWGNSVLEFGPSQTLTLTGVYTPWNFENQDTIDSDMGGGSPILLTLPAGSSTTTELLATGGKQGNGYLVDAGNNLNNPTPNPNGSPASNPASLIARPPPTESPDQDASLYDTTSSGIRNYWTTNNQGQSVGPQDGPLALFGPYNESSASGNTAKARDTPVSFVGPDGTTYVIWAGASKSGVGSSTPVPPSLIVTKVVANPGQPAYLQIVAENNQVMSNPGSGLVTGNGTANEIDWIVDEGEQRTDNTTSFSDGSPVLYAYNPVTMQLLWSSAYGELDAPFGKYNSLAVEHGEVLVGSNRLQAFGLTNNTIVDDAVMGTGTNQFNYVGSGWTHVTGSSTMGTFDDTVSTDSVQGDYATLTFTGSAISVYSNELTTYGTATFTVDGGNTQTATLTPANSSPNGKGAGDVLVYSVTGLGVGTHTLKILNNAASNTISVDRVQITPLATTHASLNIGMTDGGTVPNPGQVVPYTITYGNAGSIFNNTGVAASSVVLTDTVQANTTADLANSTPGWTLVSGSGGAGSVYSFNVGALAAGVTGSVVFSVDLNSNVPPGTTSVSNSVTISDAAGDSATGSRTTPIPPPAESKAIFFSSPPSNASAHIAMSTFSVAVEDQFGNVYTADSSSTVTLTLNDISGTGTISSGGTATLSDGIATFNNLVISASGVYTLTAKVGMLTSPASNQITVADSSKLVFTQQPTQTTAGVTVNPAVAVAVETQSNTIVTSDQSYITLAINGGTFADGSTGVTVPDVNGVATFNNLVIDATGSYTLVASDGGLPTTQSNPFNVVAIGTQLVFTQQPSTAGAGEAVNPSVTVSVEDQFGNIATGDASTVTLTLNGGTFFGGGNTTTATCVNGVATFNDLVIPATGNYTLTATDASLSSATSFPFQVETIPNATEQLLTIDDNNANNTGGTPQVTYTGSWVHSTGSSVANNYDGTISTDSTGGDEATVTFSGTLITLYALTSPTAGQAQVFIDGGNPAEINLSASTTSVQPVFTSGLLTPGTHTIIVSVASGSVGIDRFVVGPATPTLAWATPDEIEYGSTLDGTELDAYVTNYANFPGAFVYTPATGTQLPVGQNELLSVTFNPTDSADFLSNSAHQYLTVEQATPLITWTGPDSDMTYGQAIGSDQLDATATINGVTVQGTFQYFTDDADGNPTVPAAGVFPPTGEDFDLYLIFTPNDTQDYATVDAEQNVDVDPATPTITWPQPADIIDGAALTTTQLDATASFVFPGNTTPTAVPGTFAYAPAAGAVLSPGQNQSLQVLFTPDDLNDFNTVATSTLINVDYGPAAQLAWSVQPTAAASNAAISPAVAVAVEDSAGSIVPTSTDTVTLTLSSGTFANGLTTATATAVDGLATFSNLSISTDGVYTLTATTTDNVTGGPVTGPVSNSFDIGGSVDETFNTSASDLTSNFVQTTNNGTTSTAATGIYTWGSNFGVDDGEAGTAGGGVEIVSATDSTVIYQPTTVNLSNGSVHTISEFVNASTAALSSSQKILQLGFITSPTGGFNADYSFISARVYGNFSTEFQSGNGGSAASVDTTSATGTVSPGDWLQLILTTKETASGSFTGTFSLLDYGQTGTLAGVGVPKVIIAPVTYTVTGLSTIGTGTVMYGGWRNSGVVGTSQYPLEYDNFAIDQAVTKMAFLEQPSPSTAYVNHAISTPFVVAVEDINGNIVAGDNSVITLNLSSPTVTFSNGLDTLSATAVNGVATFNNVTFSVAGTTNIKTTDTNPNLDPGYIAGFIITNVPTQLAFTQQPSATPTGAAMTPAVTVAVEDSTGATVIDDGSTVTLTLNSGTFSNGSTTATMAAVNGVATFSNLIINNAGNYTLTASDSTPNSLTGKTSSAFHILIKPTLTWATPGNITYGTPLSGTQLDAASSGLAGTFTYTPAAGTVLGAGGNQTLSVLFTPTDTVDYATATDTVSINVTKATPTITWATPGNITYGTALSGTQLDASSGSVAGTLTYTPAAGTVLNAGSNQNLSVMFTPTDTVDYNTANTTVQINVAKANPIITWTNPASITYPTALSGTQLDATANVQGNFTYSPVSGTILPVGNNQTLSTTFTPADTTDYNTGNATVQINVINGNLIQPTITWATPANITYGTALSATQLDASSNVAGTFSYTPVLGTVLHAGANQVLQSLFTPQNTNVYASVITDVDINVLQVNPTLSWTTPAPIQYGTPLSSTQLNATASVPGSFTYTPVAGTTLGLGNSQTLSATFTPTDSTDYSTGNVSVLINVTKATPVITWANPAQMNYGTTLSSTQLDATANVTGTFVYTPTAGTAPTVGTDTLNVSFTPANTTDYNTATKSVQVVVVKTTPVITWPSPTAITYGTALSSKQLDATTTIAGKFVYSPVSGTVLHAGANQALSVTFTPTYTAGYNTANTTTTITVNKATPVLTWHTPANINYGTALSSTQLDATSSVGGNFSYSVLSGTVLSAGQNQSITATFTPSDATDYSTTTITDYINVAKATLTVTAANATRVYSAPNPPFTGNITGYVNGDNSSVVSGAPVYSTTATSTSNVGTYAITPSVGTLSASNYNFAYTSGNLTVTSASSGTSVASSSSTSVAGTSVTFTATVVPAGPATGTPTGTVQFKVDGSALGSPVTLSGGVATLSTSTLSVATHSVTAVYIPANSNFTASTATAISQTIISAGNQLVFTQQPTAANEGVAVSPAVTVSVETTSGSVVTSDGSTVTLTLSGGAMFSTGLTTATATASSGVATFSNLIVNTPGAYTLAATDSGDTGATSSTFDVTIPTTTEIDDRSSQVVYSSSGWAQNPSTGAYDSTISYSDTANSTASVTFEGTQIAFYAVKTTNEGRVNIAIDGTTVDSNVSLYRSSDLGNQLIYTSNVLTPGQHTMTVTVLNTKQNQSSGTYVDVDAFVITKATPTITWANPSPITTGTALSATQLAATANTTGTFTYSPAAGTVLGPGQNQTLNTFFVPSTPSTSPYATASATASISVSGASAQLAFTGGPILPTAAGSTVNNFTVNVEDALGNTVTTDSSTVTLTVNNGALFNGNSTITAVASGGVATFSNLLFNTGGTYLVTVTDGTLVGASTSIVVYAPQALSVVDDMNAAQTAGNPLITYTGSGWSHIPGTSLVNTVDDTVSNDGTAGDTASITFNGTQIVFYGGYKNTRGIVDISLDGGAQTAVDLYANDGTGFGGVPSYISPVLTPGQHTLVLTVTGTQDAQSGGDIVSIDAFDVIQATPTVTWANPADIVYGTPLSATQLDATASVPGSFTYSQAAGTVLAATQNQALTATFTPSDSADYATIPVSAQINITLDPTTTTLTTTGTPAAYGSSVSYTATVATANGVVPAGFVQFFVDGTQIGSNVQLVNGVAISSAISTLTSGNHLITAEYSPQTTNWVPSNSNTLTQQIQTAVSGIAVNGGAVQRSMVTSLTVSFTQAITSFTPGAFTLTTSTGAALPNVTVTPTLSADGTYVTLTFTGAGTINGSLTDGMYTLNVNGADITDASGLTVPGTQTFNFWRFFGDVNGTGTVNNADFVAFKAAYLSSSGQANYNAAFDLYGTGVINNADFLAFEANYLKSV